MQLSSRKLLTPGLKSKQRSLYTKYRTTKVIWLHEKALACKSKRLSFCSEQRKSRGKISIRTDMKGTNWVARSADGLPSSPRHEKLKCERIITSDCPKTENQTAWLFCSDTFWWWATLCARCMHSAVCAALSADSQSLLIKLHNSSELEWDRRTGLAECTSFCGWQGKKRQAVPQKVPQLQNWCSSSVAVFCITALRWWVAD